MTATISAITAVMLAGSAFYLTLAAFCDRNGAEVPDAITVAYAACCICAAVSQGRYIIGTLSTAALIVYLSGWKPKAMRKLNGWLMRRAYDSETEADEVEAAMNMQADAFYAKHEKHLERLYLAAGLVLVLASGVALLCQSRGGENQTQGYAAVGCLVAAVFAVRSVYGKERPAAENPDREGLSAFGGADIIVIIGIFALYGPIAFPFAVGVSFALHLLILIIRHLATRGKSNLKQHAPLLPSVWLAGPLRMAIALTVCQPMLQEARWLFQEMLQITW